MTYSTLFMTIVFEKNKTESEKKQPWWKRRLESQVKELNKDLGRLNAMLEGKKMKKKPKKKNTTINCRKSKN